MDAQATAKATTTQPKAATAMSELNSVPIWWHHPTVIGLPDVMNPSAPANKQAECQKASRLRGGGAAKVSISISRCCLQSC